MIADTKTYFFLAARGLGAGGLVTAFLATLTYLQDYLAIFSLAARPCKSDPSLIFFLKIDI